MQHKYFDVIVIGGGHGGCEAALAAGRLGEKVGLFTLYLDNIAMMSCNPSIGGPGKSNLVAEMDILGGEMGQLIDHYNLQLKSLNESKGPAARITRGQGDKFLYRKRMKEILENQENLSLIQQCVEELIVEEENGKKVIKGIITDLGIKYYAKSVILATGTFLQGRIVIGDISYEGGRQGEDSARKLSQSLIQNGIKLERYQTATPPRIDRRSIDFSQLQELKGEKNPRYFSIFTEKKEENPVSTWLTYTTDNTIEVVKEMLKYSPIVSGIINTHGPRHCPSLDRKVLNFPDKKNHQIFLELESRDSEEIYVNGLTTAMPPFVQEKMLQSIKGLENAKIMRYGYAVEYDYAPAHQLYPSLESKIISGLFFAGQINGTSGYEEAACQGFMAGVNGARKNQEKDPVIIDRSEGYIGVLIDDIIHKKTPEPYRVLPSRSEYRLTLRFDNGFMRLYEKAREIGILSQEKLNYLKDAIDIVNREVAHLRETVLPLEKVRELLTLVDSKQNIEKGIKIGDLLKIKEVTYASLKKVMEINSYEEFIENQIETILKYDTFIEREEKQIEKYKKLEAMKIPVNFDFENIVGISNIAKSGLLDIKPMSIGEASRISGVTGNDIAILIGNLK